MSKLWDKGYQIDALIESFMTGDDPILDLELVAYDCMASIAHANMLSTIGILTKEEAKHLQRSLANLCKEAEEEKFSIAFEDEDVHTAIENRLVGEHGELGKKIHTARSRNDQVMTDMRLYMKDKVIDIAKGTVELISALTDFAKKHSSVPMVGRTHFRKAMPSSVGLWAGAYGESMIDNLQLLRSIFSLIDQCPLGSAAGYGVSLPIDRHYTSEALGFAKVQNNVIAAANSRGKYESIIMQVFVQIMNDMSRLSTDLILFSAEEFGYFMLPEEICPGSSIMPQKRNPDPLELIRGKSSGLIGEMLGLIEVVRGQSSGYHRDLQETKRSFMHGVKTTYTSLLVMSEIVKKLGVDEKRCHEAFTPEVFATEVVYDEVRKGVPFRDAYKQVALKLNELGSRDPKTNLDTYSHQGSVGDIGLERLIKDLKEGQMWQQEQRERFEKIKQLLLAE